MYGHINTKYSAGQVVLAKSHGSLRFCLITKVRVSTTETVQGTDQEVTYHASWWDFSQDDDIVVKTMNHTLSEADIIDQTGASTMSWDMVGALAKRVSPNLYSAIYTYLNPPEVTPPQGEEAPPEPIKIPPSGVAHIPDLD